MKPHDCFLTEILATGINNTVRGNPCKVAEGALQKIILTIKVYFSPKLHLFTWFYGMILE